MNKKLEYLMQNLPGSVDAALITSQVNRQYYTGINSTAGIFIVTREKAWLIIDFRYIETARALADGYKVILQDKLYEQISGLLMQCKVSRVGVENAYMAISTLEIYKKKLAAFEIISDNALSDFIFAQRLIKTREELALMQQAQDIADKTFEHILGVIKPGRTELDIALEIEFFSRKNGSENVPFEVIVVSGKNSALPHGRPTDKLIERGDFITMDFGATVCGYCSDMTRTLAIGDICGEQRQIYETVLRANETAISAIKAGASCRDIDKAARDVIESAGYGKCFGHALGHSVGLEIHENPRFNTATDEMCLAGSVMTVEPGIYIEGKYGCRIEDMVYITDEGCVNLTHSPKQLIAIPF